MKIRRLELLAVSVPLRRPFRTAEGPRSYSHNLVVRAELEDGTSGWGEGVPRDYVTGETVESCIDYISALAATIARWDVADLAAAVEILWDLGEHAPDSPPSFAARCALELAILDAVMRSAGKTFDDVFETLPDFSQIHRPVPEVRYSVVASLDDPARAWRSALKYRIYGFRQAKVKVGASAWADEASLRAFRRFMGKCTEIRLDANGAWSLEDAVERLKALAVFNLASVEQPLARKDSAKLRELRELVKLPVVLDESLISARDAMLAIDGGWGDVFNLRLSKCGGFLACLKLADMARRAGVRSQLGCHPGETAILSAAGRHFACNVGPLTALEGSYDRHVLSANIIDGDVTFGFGGKAARIPGPGLGIVINRGKLDRLVSRRLTLEIG